MIMVKDRPNMREIEEFFKEEEKKKLPTINFCNLYKNDNYQKPKVNKNSLNTELNKNISELLFKQKTQENWSFDIQFKLEYNEFYLEGYAYLTDDNDELKEERQALGESLEELFINLFGKEEYSMIKNQQIQSHT